MLNVACHLYIHDRRLFNLNIKFVSLSIIAIKSWILKNTIKRFSFRTSEDDLYEIITDILTKLLSTK